MTDLPQPADPHDQISTQILKVHNDSYGTGAAGAVVHLLDDLVVVVIDELELTKGEHLMIENGHGDSVLAMRSAFQAAIEPTFTAIVERATGRRVRSFLSTTCLAPPYSLELFRLHPQAVSAPAGGLAQPTAS